MKFKKQIGIIISCVLILAIVFFAVSYIGDKNKLANKKDKSNVLETGANSNITDNTSKVKDTPITESANKTNEEKDTADKKTNSEIADKKANSEIADKKTNSETADKKTNSETAETIKEGYYEVKESDTLYSIAKTYMPNTEAVKVVEAMKERNNLTTDVISKGQKLIISYEVALQKDTNTANNTADTTDHANHVKYVVKEGDTLYSIAAEYMSSMNVMDAIDSIKTHNNIGENNVIMVSDTICIPGTEQ